MNKDTIRNTMVEVLREIMGDDSLKISDQDRLIEDIGLESIDFIDLIFGLERALKIKIDLDSFSKEMMRHNVGRYLGLRVENIINFVLIEHHEK